MTRSTPSAGSQLRRFLTARLISLLVIAHGALILLITVHETTSQHRPILSGSTIAQYDAPLLIGISLLYIGILLARRKYTAWVVTVTIYVFYLGLGVASFQLADDRGILSELVILRTLVFPLLILGLLAVYRREFVVRSDPQGLRVGVRTATLVLTAALLYGITGFTLLDKTDFHEEIGFAAAAHNTIDQFGLTTNHLVQPHTRRAQVFLDSLSVVSVGAAINSSLAFFQPLRSRRHASVSERQRMHELLARYGAPSEDYFKLWPLDKQYFFSSDQTCALAYHVWRGNAICLGDPVGAESSFGRLLSEFNDICYLNDWQPAFVHTLSKHEDIYGAQGYQLHAIGREAVVDLEHFTSQVVRNKYFRNIRNRFNKQQWTAELLQPPHSPALIARLRVVSDDWLQRGDRSERGFAMGYFDDDYLQQCSMMVVRDAAGTIQGFLNQLPAEFDSHEATYDLLRFCEQRTGNVADYLLLSFAEQLTAAGYSKLNLGLCPLAGLDDSDGLIANLMRFAYANGDKLFSFSGLYRFKNKYEPEWRPRYAAYRGGIRGFSRAVTALTRIMRVC